jgi:hypothetical protein
MKVTGTKRVKAALKDLENKLVAHAYNKALRLLGEKIGEITKSEVPIDSGQLRQSFTVEKVGNQWVCGYNTEYAACQHEGTWPNGSHIKTKFPGGGKLHFLSEPVEVNRIALMAFFSETFSNELKKLI